jgi:putative tricarboxylic transport membrane protein
MLGAGVIGYVMRGYGYEPAPLVVGLVLGPVMERSFRQTLIISGGRVESLWESPLCTAMWAIAMIAVLMPLLVRLFKAGRRALSEMGKK